MNDNQVTVPRISCDIFCDLLPLVKDGVASPGSVEVVEEHIKDCSGCREQYVRYHAAAPSGSKNALTRVRQELRIFLAMLLMIGIFFGVSLMGNGDFFYNVIIMPIIGALSYGVFKKMSFLVTPLLIFGVACLTSLLGILGGESVHEFVTRLMLTLYYDIFAIVGGIIAWLLHFALRKDD